MFVTHEITLQGYLLRRIEHALVVRELSWLRVCPERYRLSEKEHPFIANLAVRELEARVPSENQKDQADRALPTSHVLEA